MEKLKLKALSRNGQLILVGMWVTVCSEADNSRAGKHRYKVLEIMSDDPNLKLRPIKLSDGCIYDGYMLFYPSFKEKIN